MCRHLIHLGNAHHFLDGLPGRRVLALWLLRIVMSLGEAGPYETLPTIIVDATLVESLCAWPVQVIGGKRAAGVIRALVEEDLCNGYCDVVSLAANVVEIGRRRVQERNPRLMIVLELLHPGALKLQVLSQEVGLASQAVGRLAKAGNESVVELLLDAVIHTAVEDVVMEAVGEDKNDVTLPHIFMQELLGCLRVVASISAALEGEIMGLLLRGRPEVHFERVILLHVEKSIARVAKIRCLKLEAFYQLDNYNGRAALVLARCVVARLEHQLVRRAFRVNLRHPNDSRCQLH